MFQDVDQSLRALLIADVPINKTDIEVSFDRPTREWSGRLTKPALNLFLYDIREREELKDDVPVVSRDENGRAVKARPPRRLDLAYLVTAWTREPDDEHRLLGGVLASLYRNSALPAEAMQGDLKAATHSVLLRVVPPDTLLNPADLWSVLDNDLRAGINWIVTAPLDVFKPITGPLVRTKEIRVGATGEEWRETLVQVGGLAHRKGEPLSGVPGVKITVSGTGFEAKSDEGGKFSFLNLQPGEYTWRIQPPKGKAREVKVSVPSPSYDVEV